MAYVFRLGVWRVGEHRSFIDRRFFVDTILDEQKGVRQYIAEHLTREEAEEIVRHHEIDRIWVIPDED